MTAVSPLRTDFSPIGKRAVPRGHLPWPALLFLLGVALPLHFNAGPLALTTLRLLLLILIVPILINLFMGKYGRLLLPDFMFILHLAWLTLALAINNPNQVVTQFGSFGVEFLGGYLVGRAYIRNMENVYGLVRWLILIVLFLLPFGLLEALNGRPLLVEMIRKLPGISSVPIVTIEGRMGLERVQNTFAHPIHYGLFCSVAFSLTFVAMQDVMGLTKRFVVSALIMCSGFLALSSGALLAMVLQIALIGWSLIFAKIQWRWWLLVGLFALAYVVIDILSNRSPIRVFMSYATFSAHNAYWRGIIFEWGMKNVWANPIFGIGLNDWVRPFYMYSGSMDNFWLVIAVRFGIPGFLLLVIGYAFGIYRVMRRNFDMDLRLLMFRRAWVFTFMGLTFTLVTVHVWTNIYSFVFFMFGAGMWLITAQCDTSTEDDAAAGGDDDGTPETGHRRALAYSRFSRDKVRPFSV